MRILAVDYGEKRIGLALSDAMGWTAQPLEVVLRKGDGKSIEHIAQVATSRDVETILIGLPINMDASLSPMAMAAREFGIKLGDKTNIEIVEWDERLSSKSAERSLIEGGVRRKKRKGLVDKVAAAIILQSYLDFKANHEND